MINNITAPVGDQTTAIEIQLPNTMERVCKKDGMVSCQVVPTSALLLFLSTHTPSSTTLNPPSTWTWAATIHQQQGHQYLHPPASVAATIAGRCSPPPSTVVLKQINT